MLKSKRLDGYKIEDGKVCIELSLEKPEQAFDERDPAPFRNKDLDDDFVEFIFSAVQEFQFKQPMKLQVYFSERNLARKKKKPLTDEEICNAIRNHFHYMANLADKKLRKSVKNSQYFLFVGVTILFTCLFGAQLLEKFDNSVLNIIKVGVEVIAWVALWRPFEQLLYDWFPIYERRKTFEKIAGMEIKITDTQTNETTVNLPPEELK